MSERVSEKVIARAKAVNILKKLPVFQGLSEPEYYKVLAMCTSTVAKADETLVQQGDNGDSLFVLLSGEIEINVKNKGVVHTMRSGEILGEIGLVLSAPRTASAIIKKDSVLLHLKARTFHEVAQKHPHVGYVIMKNIASILAERLMNYNNS